jgi:hypothetical protein
VRVSRAALKYKPADDRREIVNRDMVLSGAALVVGMGADQLLDTVGWQGMAEGVALDGSHPGQLGSVGKDYLQGWTESRILRFDLA